MFWRREIIMFMNHDISLVQLQSAVTREERKKKINKNYSDVDLQSYFEAKKDLHL
uniref:Uncharacterized protein n=1 Tax=Lepeophtheirus salmonis TaxID=72036 RepID=A0A0K2TS31_LEPSM